MINCVVSRYKKNTDWVYRLENIKNVYIYDKETPENPYNIPVNKGQEASVYLKYIIDNYESLEDFTFFTHDDEYCWHHSGSIVDRYNEAVNEVTNRKLLYFNINNRCVLGSIVSNPLYSDILKWYNEYIEKYIPMNSLPNKDWTKGHRGSAQFLVHKSLITNLPKDFYQSLYSWITTTELGNNVTSRFMEWTWHIFWVLYPNIQRL
jgi:hypothetical protein